MPTLDAWTTRFGMASYVRVIPCMRHSKGRTEQVPFLLQTPRPRTSCRQVSILSSLHEDRFRLVVLPLRAKHCATACLSPIVASFFQDRPALKLQAAAEFAFPCPNLSKTALHVLRDRRQRQTIRPQGLAHEIIVTLSSTSRKSPPSQYEMQDYTKKPSNSSWTSTLRSRSAANRGSCTRIKT